MRLIHTEDRRQIEGMPGASVFVPRGVPHTFQNTGDAPGRILGVVEPAGLEGFFRELAEITKQGLPETSVLNSVFEKHGQELLGPPPAVRLHAL